MHCNTALEGSIFILLAGKLFNETFGRGKHVGGNREGHGGEIGDMEGGCERSIQ